MPPIRSAPTHSKERKTEPLAGLLPTFLQALHLRPDRAQLLHRQIGQRLLRHLTDRAYQDFSRLSRNSLVIAEEDDGIGIRARLGSGRFGAPTCARVGVRFGVPACARLSVPAGLGTAFGGRFSARLGAGGTAVSGRFSARFSVGSAAGVEGVFGEVAESVGPTLCQGTGRERPGGGVGAGVERGETSADRLGGQRVQLPADRGATVEPVLQRQALRGVDPRGEILVDHARRRNAAKRDGGERVGMTQLDLLAGGEAVDVADLNDALERLEHLDPGLGRLVELRYFGGLTIEETAQVLGSSPATVKRQWQTARVWLFEALADGARTPGDDAAGSERAEQAH